jgi:hypothetical protein
MFHIFFRDHFGVTDEAQQEPSNPDNEVDNDEGDFNDDEPDAEYDSASGDDDGPSPGDDASDPNAPSRTTTEPSSTSDLDDDDSATEYPTSVNDDEDGRDSRHPVKQWTQDEQAVYYLPDNYDSKYHDYYAPDKFGDNHNRGSNANGATDFDREGQTDSYKFKVWKWTDNEGKEHETWIVQRYK